MKRLTALALALCLLLSACGTEASPGAEATPSASAPVDPAPSAPASADPAPSAPAPTDAAPSDPAASPSAPAAPVPTDSAPSGYVPPDYSAHAEIHPDEAHYNTTLADLTPLSRGERTLALERGPADWSFLWSGKKEEVWGYDARSCDLTGESLGYIQDWNDVTFNSETVWPEADKMPEGFDPDAVLELSKDPGLGIRALHEQGITGEGVGIAILDQPLYTGHEQYRDNLMLYEEIHALNDGTHSELHGPSVSSIAVGKDIGVAPGAKLYFIASEFGHSTENGFEYDMGVLADGIYRVLEINRALPEGEKIRVISISLGMMVDTPGLEKVRTAVDAANAEGILVLTTSTDLFYPTFSFGGLCRDGLADPNDPLAYGPASWLIDLEPDVLNVPENHVLVPMGGRTYAACTGESDYEWNRQGGMSWAVPWMAGFYALCCQADPDCTPERFFAAVQDTATVELTRDNGLRYFGRIIDPAAAIDALRSR